MGSGQDRTFELNYYGVEDLYCESIDQYHDVGIHELTIQRDRFRHVLSFSNDPFLAFLAKSMSFREDMIE